MKKGKTQSSFKLFVRMKRTILTMLVMVGSIALSGIFQAMSAQQPGITDRVSRYEFAEALEQAQCRDCKVPLPDERARYGAGRLSTQQSDPQKSIDDVTFDQAIWQGENYYYCVAGVVDRGIMQGFPRSTSPYCPGKFCGSSFLTVVELVESVVRLLGPEIWSNYAVDRRQVAVRAKDAPSVSLTQRSRVAQALRRCPDTACPAENIEEFDLWLRWCSTDIARCDFLPYGDFTAKVSWTPKLNILLKEGILSEDRLLGNRFDLIDRETMTRVLGAVKSILLCENTLEDDYDGDGIPNALDLCPYAYDPAQHDMDGDGVGDVCDDDIDGDGVKNEIGVVDARGAIILRLAMTSDDNCVLLPNPQQTTTQDSILGDDCNPESDAFVSRFSALEVDATPYRGNAPLMVDFSQENIGIDGPLQRDFNNGVVHTARETSHIFTDPGLYMVQASTVSGTNQVVSIIPIEVLLDLRVQVGLEVLSKDLIASVGMPLLIQHVGVGDIQKLTIRATGVDETVNIKESATIVIESPGAQKVELQAYNSVGQRVALSQFTVDLTKQIGSQIHASSLDPEVNSSVDFTTILGGVTPEEVYTVQRDFGDNQRIEDGSLIASHAWSTPGVYMVKQLIQFRDRTRPNHENILTVLVRPDELGRKLHLGVDELQKGRGESFTFTLATENFPVEDMRQCTRLFTPTDHKKIFLPTVADLTQTYAFRTPGSHPVFVLCQSTALQWYHTAVTVAVEESDFCLQNMDTLRCDMDDDGIPDLCDDDIDGDGIPNWMNLLTRELPDCSIDSRNIDQQLFSAYTLAISAGAPFDNCPFVVNPDQEDNNRDGIGIACEDAPLTDTGTGSGAGSGGASAGAGDPGSSAGGASAGGDSGGGGADSDGDGIPDVIDACPNTPESADGSSDGDGCPEAPEDESTDPTVPNNPFVEVGSCTQCPCPEADYASSLRKGDRVRALLLDELGSIIYKYTKPEIIQEDIPDKLLGR